MSITTIEQLAAALRALYDHNTQPEYIAARQAAREALARYDAERMAPRSGNDENEPLTPREVATVLAALRCWQIEAPDSERHESRLATDDGAFAPLDDGEIDALCERINA